MSMQRSGGKVHLFRYCPETKPLASYGGIREVWLGPDSSVSSQVVLGKSRTVSGTIAVLGGGGMFLAVDQEFTVGNELGISGTLPATQRTIVCAGIVRNQIPGQGI